METHDHTLGSLLRINSSIKLLAPETKTRYELVARNLARYLSGPIAQPGDIELSRLTIAALIGFRDWSLKRMRPTSFNTERRHLSALFNLAVRQGLMTANPFREVSRAPEPRLLPKAIPRPDMLAAVRFLEVANRTDRFGRVRDVIDAQWFWLTALKTFYFTGMRKRQLVGLLWDDIDFHGMTIKLRAATSKTRREWLIPLSAPILGDLSRLHAKTIEVRGTDLTGCQVFCLPLFSGRKRAFAERLMNADNVDSFFQRLRKLLPKGSPRISAHRIRHTTATLLANKVKNLKIVQEQLGHSSILTTFAYVHPDLESMRDALAVL